ncbi:CD320 antigen, partial [Suncus etruscus]|uniref:CD320 antigen n=1 Tax=Suncus etruscus TaxID=109475 RepID=UPI0021103BD1
MARGEARLGTALCLALRLLLAFELGRHVAPNPLPPGPGPLQAAQGSCSPSSFQCRSNGFCVPLTWRCDDDEDCPDGSDEEACSPEPCAQEGSCSPPTSNPCSCDNIRDCPPAGDQGRLNCTFPPCPMGELRCLQGSVCIPHTWLCDGHRDCPDASDEQSCGLAAGNQADAAGNGSSTVTTEVPGSTPGST